MKALLILGLLVGVAVLAPTASAHIIYIEYDPQTAQCVVVLVIGDPNGPPHGCVWIGPNSCQALC